MLLKKIILKNIRSYENIEIEFSQGRSLLSGDIGTGKTSVLLGIEFALFGLQPGQRGNSLLRNGKNQGSVKIEIEIDGKEILIERTLKKAKAISQDYCSITINGEKQEISVTELKIKVLRLLNYPEEFVKKQNLLYKFTVYTPQEEMKQIILQDPKTRINTLRHIFGIDKYKRILENLSIITGKLREEKKKKEGMVETLETDKFDLIEKENELENKHYNLVSIEKEFFLKTDKRKKIEEESQEINKKIEEKIKLQQEIEKTKIMILNKKNSINENKKIIEELKNQMQELQKLHFDESEIINFETKITNLKSQHQKFRDDLLKIASQISSIELKINDNEKIKEKLSHIEVCPTCLQDVNSSYKLNVIKRLDSNNSENSKKIQILKQERENVEKKIQEINFKISEEENSLNNLKILKIKLQGIDEKQKNIENIEKNNSFLEKDANFLEEQIKILNENVFELKKYENVFEQNKKEFEQAMQEEKRAEIRVAELKREISVFSKHLEELRGKIKEKEKIRETMNYLAKLESWISKDFASIISLIEKNVMAKLKTDFSKLFNQWFCMLVSDSLNVRLNDDFTPIIEQQDYELDYAYLSGGERTAVALAYRLALNQEINSFLSKIKTKGIIILDEPTDGFSEQQLDKMRDVLQQLDVEQLIIVSHEQKIEDFVENVIKLKKENNISRKE